MSPEYLLLGVNHKLNTFASHYQGVKRVIQVMSEHLSSPLTLQDMADIAKFSPYHFNRVFHYTTGIPPAQFLCALRLQEAKRLLLTSQGSVTDICFEVGYNSLGTFTRRFTELVGLSPTKLRRLHDDPHLFALELLHAHDRRSHHEVSHQHRVTGRISAPVSCSGSIFVSLFPTQIPQGWPVACTFLPTIGTYSIAPVPKGRYFLFAAAYSCSPDPVYAGIGQEPVLLTNDQTDIYMDITLRPTCLTDPPVLIAAPYLCTRHLIMDKKAIT